MPRPKRGTPEYETWRNSPQYRAYRQKLQEIRKRQWQDPNSPYRSEEFRAKQSQSKKKLWQEDEFRKKQRQIRQTEEHREKLSQVLQERWQDEEYREKHRQALQERWQDPNSSYNTEEYREKLRQIRRVVCRSKTFREKMSQIVQECWKDPDYARKVLTQFLQQTRPEQLMEHLLDELFPGEYEYVGDGQLIIGGKCPDFANVNGKKKLIEVFGDYWHAGQDPQERIDFFCQYGFDCLVIWESELENLEEVAEKLRQFHSKI